MLIARILHVVGNIIWLGGGAAAALAMVQLTRESRDAQLAGARAARRLVLQLVTPGMLLSFAGGLYMLISYWSELYAKAPWMHTKLTVGLIAAAFSGMLSGKLRRASGGGDALSAGTMKLTAAALLLSAVAGVALVFTRVGGR